MTTVQKTSDQVATPILTTASSTTQDSSLARYMTELSGYELLTHADEIELARAVEQLEIAYWQALMSWPRAHSVVRAAILANLETPPKELASIARTVRAASASK